MKKIGIISAVMIIIAAALVLGGCEEKNGFYDDIDIAGYNGSGSEGDISQFVASGSDILPDGAIGTWEPAEIYQYAVASDISDEKALELEKQYGLTLGYSSFNRYGDDINGAVYKINTEATLNDVIKQGIQVDPLIERYGETAKVTAIEVYDNAGTYCTTLFFIPGRTGDMSATTGNTEDEGDIIISYGAGMYVFEYELTEAVG